MSSKNIGLSGLPGSEILVVDDTYLNVDSNNKLIIQNPYSHLNKIENLLIENNKSNPTTEIDITWDTLDVDNFRTTSFIDTIDLTNDLDTGSPQATAMYYIHAMTGQGETTICKFSLSYNNPTLPVNYTNSKLISFIYRSAGSFNNIYQKNRNMMRGGLLQLISQTMNGATYFPFDLNTIPQLPEFEILTDILCFINLSHNTSGPDLVYIYDDNGLNNIHIAAFYDKDNSGGLYAQYIHPVTLTLISINSSPGSDVNFTIYCTGFKLNI